MAMPSGSPPPPAPRNDLEAIKRLLESIERNTQRPGGPGGGDPQPPRPPQQDRHSAELLKAIIGLPNKIASQLPIVGGFTSFGGILGQLISSFKSAIETNSEIDKIFRQGGGKLGNTFEQITKDLDKHRVGLGVSLGQFGKLVQSFTRETGVTAERGAVGDASKAAFVSRSIGLDLATGVSGIGAISAYGGTSASKASEELAKNFYKFGIARIQPYLEDTRSFTEDTAKTLGRSAPEQSKLYAELRGFAESVEGRIGADNLSTTLKNMNSALENPGGGFAGELFMRQLTERVGAKDIYTSNFIREQGMLARGPNGKMLLDEARKMIKETNLPEMTRLAIAKNLGFGNMHQFQAFDRMLDKFTPADRKKFEDIYAKAKEEGKVPDFVKYEKFQNASSEELFKLRDQNKDKVPGLEKLTDPEAIRDALISGVAMASTPETEFKDAVSKLDASIEKLVREGIPLFTDAIKAFANIVNALGPVLKDTFALVKTDLLIAFEYFKQYVATPLAALLKPFMADYERKIKPGESQEAYKSRLEDLDARDNMVKKMRSGEYEKWKEWQSQRGRRGLLGTPETDEQLKARIDRINRLEVEARAVLESEKREELDKKEHDQKIANLKKELDESLKNIEKSGEKFAQAIDSALGLGLGLGSKSPSYPGGIGPDMNERLRGGSSGYGSLGDVNIENVAAPTGSKADKMRRLMDYYKKTLGLNDTQAAGLVGNLQFESGLSTTALGDHGRSHGLGQWNGDRYARLIEYARRTNRDVTDWNVQMEFVAKELKGTHSTALSNLRKVQTLEDATHVINRDFEGSADSQPGGRADLRRYRVIEAQKALKSIQGRSNQSSIPRVSKDGSSRPDWLINQEYEQIPQGPSTNKLEKANDDQSRAIGGEINLNIVHRDKYGRPISDKVAHQLNLRDNSLYGEVYIPGINPAYST